MAGFDENARGGLIGKIRALTESEQFDLSGYTQERAHDLIVSSFSTPLSHVTSMIRVTFVVGGGKLVRSRYDEDLPKWLMNGLREIGYTEDKSAAETLDSQGTYKHQHDTGQNLKYLIVFPKVCVQEAPKESISSSSVELTPEDLVIQSELSTFYEMVNDRVTSWQQKKKLVKFLQTYQENFKSLEAKLIAGHQLSPTEQKTYDEDAGNSQEKINWLQGEIKRMVDEGKLSSLEKEELVKTIKSNMESMKASSNGKNEEKLAALKGRAETISRMPPQSLRLKYGDEIQELYVKVFTLEPLEEKSRQMSLTLAELKALEEKHHSEMLITSLEQRSREWFQEDSDHLLRCENEKQAAKVKYLSKVKSKSGSKSATTTSSSSTHRGNSSSGNKSSTSMNTAGGWSNVVSKGNQKVSNSSSASKSSNSRGSSSFAAMMNDDSDED